MSSITHDDGGAAQRKTIMRTALILSALTAFEFLIAFTWKPLAIGIGMDVENMRLMKNLLFFLLTIFKAFYIVAVFMHLGDEVRRMALTIVLPFIFIIWLIIGMMIEGNYYGKLTKKAYGENNSYQVPAQVEPGPVYTIKDPEIIRYGRS